MAKSIPLLGFFTSYELRATSTSRPLLSKANYILASSLTPVLLPTWQKAQKSPPGGSYDHPAPPHRSRRISPPPPAHHRRAQLTAIAARGEHHDDERPQSSRLAKLCTTSPTPMNRPTNARCPPQQTRPPCVGAGSRKERQPGLATGQCRASSRVTSHMESATLIGGSTPGREPTYYGPHVCTQGSRLWAKEMGAPGPKGPQKRARTDTQSSQTHRTPTRRST